ncbi:hypothetical protein OBBRIDRAFT_190778 [Obba rivulosa]|uniref:Uncharacterized protein n=1 Tax=Obba rivulosa TaxID=1052685 RepID=A0A8E2AS19_9APHY|nr:hypothetical protein OBBRIDRAFT_190778 [Obba rivulosa]
MNAYTTCHPPRLSMILEVMTRASLILCDTIMLYTTVSSMYVLRGAARYSNIGTSLWIILIRDGILHFSLLSTINCAQMILYITGKFGSLPDFSFSLSSIIISRFILNIREVYDLSSYTLDAAGTFFPPSHYFRDGDGLEPQLGKPSHAIGITSAEPNTS